MEPLASQRSNKSDCAARDGVEWMSRVASSSPPRSPEDRSPRTVRATQSLSARAAMDWLSRLTSSPDSKSPKPEQLRRGLMSKYRHELRRSPLALVLLLSVALNALWLTTYKHARGCSAGAVQPGVKPPLRIGGEVCTTPALEDLRSHLGNVVLVVNVNYDFVARNTSAFLKEVYGRFFLDVVFIGPNNIPDLGVEARAHTPWRHRWCYAYYYFPTIVARYPNADGYLWMNDDVVLNYWTLINADTNKLWLPDTPLCWKDEKEGCQKGGPIPHPEICRCQGSIPFADGQKADITDGWSATLWHKKLVRQAWGSLDGAFKVQHAKSVRTTREYQKRVVDVWYVPRRLAMTMAFKLMPSFVEAAVWSEVAIPMMFHAMESPANYDPVFANMVYRWERRPDYNPLQWWNSTISAFHHWKLASHSGKVALLNAFRTKDKCLNVLLTKMQQPQALVASEARREAVIAPGALGRAVTQA